MSNGENGGSEGIFETIPGGEGRDRSARVPALSRWIMATFGLLDALAYAQLGPAEDVVLVMHPAHLTLLPVPTDIAPPSSLLTPTLTL